MTSAILKNKVVVFQFGDDKKNMLASIVDKFKREGWESSYKEPYTEDIIAFVCQHLNEAVLNFDESKLETKHKEHDSISLKSDSGRKNKENAGTASTKPKDSLNMEESNSDGATSDMSGTSNNDEETIKKGKKRKTYNPE